MNLPRAAEDLAGLDDLIARFNAAAEGHDTLVVATAAASILGQAIARSSLTMPSAQTFARKYGQAIADDIAKNWPLVTNDRARG
jgi:hypothetical protein